MTTITGRSSGIRSQLKSNKGLVFLAVVGLMTGLLAAWLTIGFFRGSLPFGPRSFNGIVMQSPMPTSDFSLTAHTGEKVHLQDFRGKVLLIYFGYTYCPDVCPSTLSSLATALDRLDPEERQQVQVLMVTVDPERDTPEVLAKYLAYFDPSFLGLTGTADEIAAAAAPFGIFYQKHEMTSGSGYMVDHTTTVAAVDKEGYLRLIYPFSTPGEDIAADLSLLIRD